MTDTQTHPTDWDHHTKILNEILVPLETICALLPNGTPKLIGCGVVAGLQALITVLPNNNKVVHD